MNFEQLSGRIALANVVPNDYIDWAENLLTEGVESENVAILASLGLDKQPDSEDIKIFFKKSLKDLNLELPLKKDGLLAYAVYLCKKIVNGEISSKKGVNELSHFFYQSGYEPIYGVWDELNDDIWAINNGGHHLFNSNLTKENIDQYIKKMASQFIQLTEIKLPERFFHFYACSKCGYIGEYKLERIEKLWIPEKIFSLIFRRAPACQGICEKCASPYLNSMSDYETRKQYLELKC